MRRNEQLVDFAEEEGVEADGRAADQSVLEGLSIALLSGIDVRLIL